MVRVESWERAYSLVMFLFILFNSFIYEFIYSCIYLWICLSIKCSFFYFRRLVEGISPGLVDVGIWWNRVFHPMYVDSLWSLATHSQDPSFCVIRWNGLNPKHYHPTHSVVIDNVCKCKARGHSPSHPQANPVFPACWSRACWRRSRVSRA